MSDGELLYRGELTDDDIAANNRLMEEQARKQRQLTQSRRRAPRISLRAVMLHALARRHRERSS